MSTPDPTQALAVAKRTFHEAIHRAVATGIAHGNEVDVAAVLTGYLASIRMFAEVTALAEASRVYVEAQNTCYDDAIKAHRREHQAVMREDDGTPDYMREGGE